MDARLVPGDVIIAVDGHKLETLSMAKDLVIGQEGTPVVIEVRKAASRQTRVFPHGAQTDVNLWKANARFSS